jgi:hypothetical protein
VADLPAGLDEARNVNLIGRARHPWYRRALLGLVCVIPLLALLGLFGQHATTSAARGSEGTLKVQAPKRLRGGLVWQVRLDVTAAQDIKNPQLVLSPGWWEQNSVNSIEPNPISESSSNGRVVLSYGPLHAGQKLTAWVYFQVNPINIGHRTATVQLNDGAHPVAAVHRTLTIFP